MKQELINRWDNFLQNIEKRFQQSLQQAEEASFDLLEESNYDYNQTTQGFSGIKMQIQNLIRKIDETWDNKVRSQMEDAFENTDWVDESQKGSKLSAKLWEQLREFQLVLEGKLSKKYYDHAIKIADADFHCSQCNAKLQIVKTIFRSQYVTCDYCSTVNTFEPESKFSQMAWGIVDNIIKYNLLEEEKALTKTYHSIKENAHFGKATEQDWKKYKTQYLTYHEHFFKERIKLNSEYEQHFEGDMQRKLKEFEDFKKSR